MTKQRVSIAVLMALLFSGMCVVENSAVRAKPEDRAAGSVSSVYMLAGEFRTVFANLLWIKVDQYHHEFIEHNPNWTQNKDSLGLIRLITSLDPHFSEAYATGSLIYLKGCNDRNKAAQYLEEGIANNPRDWDLHRLAVLLYARHFNDPVRALPHAKLALEYCDDPNFAPRLAVMQKSVKRMIHEQNSARKSGDN